MAFAGLENEDKLILLRSYCCFYFSLWSWVFFSYDETVKSNTETIPVIT